MDGTLTPLKFPSLQSSVYPSPRQTVKGRPPIASGSKRIGKMLKKRMVGKMSCGYRLFLWEYTYRLVCTPIHCNSCLLQIQNGSACVLSLSLFFSYRLLRGCQPGLLRDVKYWQNMTQTRAHAAVMGIPLHVQFLAPKPPPPRTFPWFPALPTMTLL